MSEIRLEYGFNTFFLAVDETTGEYPKDLHKERALEFRGRLCHGPKGDGISNVEVNSSGFNLRMNTMMTTIGTVDDAVARAMDWARTCLIDVFPNRGDKVPTATRLNFNDPSKSPSTIVKLFANLDTDLYPYPLNKEEREAFENTFARLLVQFDGALGYGIAMRTVMLKFDSAQRTIREAEDHMDEVLTIAASAALPAFFPFVAGPYPSYRFDMAASDS